MENNLENLVLLYENGKYSYGIITIEDKNSHVSGTDIRSFGEKGIIKKIYYKKI